MRRDLKFVIINRNALSNFDLKNLPLARLVNSDRWFELTGESIDLSGRYFPEPKQISYACDKEVERFPLKEYFFEFLRRTPVFAEVFLFDFREERENGLLIGEVTGTFYSSKDYVR